MLKEDLREIYWNKLMDAFGIEQQMPLTNERFDELSKSPLLLFLVVWTIKNADSKFEDFKNTAELYDTIFRHIYTREYNRASERELYFKSKEYQDYQQMLHYLGGCAYKDNSRFVAIGNRISNQLWQFFAICFFAAGYGSSCNNSFLCHSYMCLISKESCICFTDIRNRILTEYWAREDKEITVKDYVIAENQYDTFMKYSDYCNLREMLGLSQIPLTDGQYIIHCLPYLKDVFSIDMNLTVKDDSLICSDIFTEAFSQYGGYGNGQDMVIVVPDHYIENMKAIYSLYVVRSDAVIDSNILSELGNTFPQIKPLNSNVVTSGENGYSSKILGNESYYYTGKLADMPTSQAILIILPLCYLSLVIGIISIVILAIQLLTEVKTIKRHYDVMRTLGNEIAVLAKMLRKHIFLYFALPFVPALVIGSYLLKTISHALFAASYDVPLFDNLTTLIAFIVLSSLLIFTLIYFLYVVITSQAMRKEIIPTTLEE